MNWKNGVASHALTSSTPTMRVHCLSQSVSDGTSVLGSSRASYDLSACLKDVSLPVGALASTAPSPSRGELVILTSSLPNGSVLYAPFMSPGRTEAASDGALAHGAYQQSLLRAIIASDVSDPTHGRITEKEIDSRNTVVKKQPDGAVQITYRKMVQQPCASANPVPVKILPKIMSSSVSAPFLNGHAARVTTVVPSACLSGHHGHTSWTERLSYAASSPVTCGSADCTAIASRPRSNGLGMGGQPPLLPDATTAIYRPQDSFISPSPIQSSSATVCGRSNDIKALRDGFEVYTFDTRDSLSSHAPTSMWPADTLRLPDSTVAAGSSEAPDFMPASPDFEVTSCGLTRDDVSLSLSGPSWVDSAGFSSGVDLVSFCSMQMPLMAPVDSDRPFDTGSCIDFAHIDSLFDPDEFVPVQCDKDPIGVLLGDELSALEPSSKASFLHDQGFFYGLSASSSATSSPGLSPHSRAATSDVSCNRIAPLCTVSAVNGSVVSLSVLEDDCLLRSPAAVNATSVSGVCCDLPKKPSTDSVAGVLSGTGTQILTHAVSPAVGLADERGAKSSGCTHIITHAVSPAIGLADGGGAKSSGAASPCCSSAGDDMEVDDSFCSDTLSAASGLSGSEHLIDIIDVSPELASTQGGSKIILIGSWNAKDARYSCKFGDVHVEARLIQNGVLRCHSPPHVAGKVQLCVFCNGARVSHNVDFEFIAVDEPAADSDIRHQDWLCLTDISLQRLLVDRISGISDILGFSNALNSDAFVFENVEGQLMEVCEKLVAGNARVEVDYAIGPTMTVLHLAAALGYRQLIQLLYIWLDTKENPVVLVEACPWRPDQFGLVPLMWASAKGHFDALSVLIQWDEEVLLATDKCGCTAIDLAVEQGHSSVAIYLQTSWKKWHSSREKAVNSQLGENAATCLPDASGVLHVQGTSSSGSPTCPRTLGRTLAIIQSMISDDQESVTKQMEEMSEVGEESVFEVSPFTPMQRSFGEDRSPVLASPCSPSGQTPVHWPFTRTSRETAEFCEFFYKSRKIEKDFAELTLTDEEHEELYRAANVIQSAFKAFKERKSRREVEFQAATLIQSYYRRYKQYAAFKRMQKGALIIQNQYRAHRENRKKRSAAASVIQSCYRRYRERKQTDRVCCGDQSELQVRFRLQQQAGRKANRFLQQTANRFSCDLSGDLVEKGPNP